MERRIHQEQGLKSLVKNGGFQFTETFFPYTSGQIGPYYVQSAAVMKGGSDYFLAVNALVSLMLSHVPPYSFEVVSGGESRDWVFSNPVAYQLNKPHVSIYKDKRIIGADVDGKRAVHVADLNNEGSSPRDVWVPVIRGGGGKIEDIFFFVDRMEDGVEEMRKLGLRSHAVVPLDEHAWDYLLERGEIESAVYNSLRERMEDKDAWARKMLRSDAGFAKLKELYFDRKTKPKAEKIMRVGYPSLEDEMMDRIVASRE